MNEDEATDPQVDSQEISEEVQEEFTKFSFDTPKENWVVPMKTRIKLRIRADMMEVKFWAPGNAYHTKRFYPVTDNEFDILMSGYTPRGYNAADWSYRDHSGRWSGLCKTGYWHVVDIPVITEPKGATTISTKDTVFRGNGDTDYSTSVQLCRASDDLPLSDWVVVQKRDDFWGGWVMPLTLPIGVYDVYLAGNGPYWQVKSRSDNLSLTVNWTPLVTSPANNAAVQSSSGFTISGVATPNAKVNLHITELNVVALHIPVDSRGNWSVFVNNRTNMKLEFVTQQYIDKFHTGHSAVHTVYLLGKPVITRPQDGIVFNDKPTIAGSHGCPGAEIEIVETNVGTTPFGRGIVAANGSWSIPLTVALHKNLIHLTCKQVMRGVASDWADSQQFSILTAPVVTVPSDSVDTLASITGTHTTGVAGIQVDIHRDLDKVKIGQGITTATGWSAKITTALEPGVRAVTARLAYQARFSGFSSPVNLRVRPNPPVINQVVFYITKTAFKGSALPDAIIEIHPASGKPNATGLVNKSGLFETTALTFHPGWTGSGWGARQRISDGDSGWIYSLYHPTEPKFDVPMLPPTVDKPTLNGQIPTVTGRGNIWEGFSAAKIKVDLVGTKTITLPLATVTAGGTWEVKGAEAIAPGAYRVKVWQVMNGVESEPVELTDSLVIKPLAPADVDVVANGLTATFSGSCWPAASITLLFKVEGEDKETPIAVGETPGGTWTSLPITFVPGEYTFTVTQTFNGQTSNAVGPVPFNIATPRANIIFPANQQETDLQPEIRGNNGYRDAISNIGATIQVFSNSVAGPALGETIVTANEWVVKLNKSLPVGQHDIYVLQTFNKQPSQRSVSVLFNAMVPQPSIEVPVNNLDYGRRSEFSGKALPGAKVSLFLVENPGLPNETETEYVPPGGVVVDANGAWKAQVFFEQIAWRNLRIKQSFGGGTRASVIRKFRTVTNAPVIESPNAGESVNPVEVVVSGHSFPGDAVKVRRKGYSQVMGNFPVDAYGRWSGKLIPTPTGDSPYSLEAWSIRDSHGGDISEAAVIELLDLASPIINHPSSGDVLVSRLVFSGEGLAGAQIQVADLFNPETPLAPVATVDASGQWIAFGNTDFAAGPHWVIAQQTLGGKKSPWVRSGRFIIEEPPFGFSAPTVDRPWPGEQVGREPMLAGSGQVGAVVYVRQNGKELCQARVSENGRWAMRLPEFAVGKQTLKVLQARYRVWSAESKPDPTFEVIQVSAGFAAPTLESPVEGATVDTRFWMSGKGMPGAVIKVQKNGDHSTIYAETLVDAYGKWQACINKALPIGDFKFGAKQVIDGVESLYFQNVTVKVTDVLPMPILESHSNGEQVVPVTLLKGRGFPRATVFLYKSGDPNNAWGVADVTDDGYWECSTKPLPLGRFQMGGRQMLPSIVGPWMKEFTFQVVNAG